jgi:hypothetical protein
METPLSPLSSRAKPRDLQFTPSANNRTGPRPHWHAQAIVSPIKESLVILSGLAKENLHSIPVAIDGEHTAKPLDK